MNLQQLVAQLNSSGQKYHVSSQILLGVFGMETNFGDKNWMKTSSAGAEGTMQFIPSTARQYGYPMTNNPTPAQSQQQFDAAAHYLSDLYKQHGGNWDAALRAYSGNGYGLSQVQAKAKSAMGTSGAAKYFNGIQPGITPPSIPNPLDSVSGAITGVWNALVNDAKYAAVLIVVLALGAFLIVHGLSGVTGGGGSGKPRMIPVPV